MSTKSNIQKAYKAGIAGLTQDKGLSGLGLAGLVTKATSPTDLTRYLTTGANLLNAANKATSAVDRARNTNSKTSTAGIANATEIPTTVYPTIAPKANYSDMYNAYEQAMNARANAYNAQSNADAADVARQLQIVGNQGKSALYGAQGDRGQDVSETSLLQNELSTGNTQGGVRSAYDAAMRDVGMAKDQNLAETDRLLGNQQVSYENQLQDLANQYSRDVDDFNRSVEHQKKLSSISEKAEYDANRRNVYEQYGTDYSTLKAYDKAIDKLAKDGKTKSDWKIQYLKEKRAELQKEVDKQKLAEQKNTYSKSLSKYKSTDQIDKAIAKILSDGDTSNDWKLSYLNKYRTILNRKEVAARKAAKAAKKKSKNSSESDSGGENGGGGSDDGNTKLNQKARTKAKKDLKGNISLDYTNVWHNSPSAIDLNIRKG